MRNLKRALSLALASVMLLGMMVVGTSAASYADVDSADNVEAIEVMQAVGVMSGDTNGNFNPDQKVTRGEMAVVMTNLLGLKVTDYVGMPLTFTDVPDWGKGFVAACVANGIAAGYNDKQFGFNDSVTTAQAALMMMKAIGYFQYTSDFGQDWQVATVKQGSKIGIFEGIESGAAVAMTRNEVAQMGLNALKATTVEPDDSTISITTPDGTTVAAGEVKYDYVVSTAASYNTAIGNTGAAVQYLELGESLYKGDLRLTTAGQYDIYGRPANTWAYKNVTVGKYGTDADLTYTAAASGDTTAAKLSNMGIKDYRVTSANLYINGAPQAAVTSLNSIPGLTGNGTKVELYLSDTTADLITTIVITKTELVQVASKTASRITLTSKNTAVAGSLYINDDEDLFNAVKAYNVDDYLLVTPVYDTAASRYVVDAVAAPQVVTGNITAIGKASDGTTVNKLTVGGAEYSASAVASTGVTGAAVDTKNESTLWLDSYGYVIHAKASTPATEDFLYVLKAYKTLKDGKIVDMAQGILTNGDIVDVQYDGLAGAATDCTLYAVTDTDDDVYTLNASYTSVTPGTNGSTSGALAAVKNVITLESAGTIKDTDRTLTAGSAGDGAGSEKYFNNYFGNKVAFVYVDTTNKTATVKVGVQNVPTLGTAYAVVEANSTTDSTPVVKMVILVNTVSTSQNAEDLLYVSSNTTTGSVSMYNKDTEKYETIPTYTAYKNGEKVTIATKTSVSANTFYTYAESESTGAYVLASYSATTGEGAVQTNQAVSGTFDKRMITVNGVSVDVTKAIITDLRSAADQANLPIALSAAGLCDAYKIYNGLTLSVIYDADSMTASHVYVVDEGSGYTVTAATMTSVSGYSIATDKTSANVGDTVTVTVTVTAVAASKTLTFAAPAGAAATSATTASHTTGTAATYTFTYVMTETSTAAATVTLA